MLRHIILDGNVEAEISYRIKPQHWNFGFATEAAQACKEYAEKVLNKNRLISIIHPENIASKCVAEKLGAKKRMSPPLRGQSMKYMFTERIRRVRPLLPGRSLVLTCL